MERVELGATERAAVVPPPEEKAACSVLEVRFKDLANRDLEPHSGRLLLRRDGSAATEHEIRESGPVRISDLESGRYEIRVRVEGFDESTSTVDVSETT